MIVRKPSGCSDLCFKPLQSQNCDFFFFKSAPKLQVVTDPNRDVALLRLENADAGKEDKVMCQMMWNEMPGGFLAWVSGEKHTSQFLV